MLLISQKILPFAQVLFLLLLITYVTFSREHYSISWFHTKKSDSLSLWKFSHYN